MGNDCTSALASVEATATRGAISVARASTGDELRAGGSSRRGRGRRSSGVVAGTTLGNTRGGLSVGSLNGLGSVVVGGGVAEAATTVTLLSDDCTSTFAGVEAAAAGGTVGVALAGASDELSAGRCTGDVCSSGN